MTENLVSAFIGLGATIASVTISTFVTLRITRTSSMRQERQWLKDQVNQYVTLSLQYPKVDDDQFARDWKRTDRTDDGMRYENFCCFAFNLLERAWLHTDGDTEKLRDIVFFEEIILRHKNWWRQDRLNHFGYDANFKEFVNNIISTGGPHAT